MRKQSEKVNWLLLIVSMLIGAVGIFQLGYIIGEASFSNSDSFQQIGLLQIALIGSGVWGVSIFIKLITVSKST